jgi:hypothetical protein
MKACINVWCQIDLKSSANLLHCSLEVSYEHCTSNLLIYNINTRGRPQLHKPFANQRGVYYASIKTSIALQGSIAELVTDKKHFIIALKNS